MVQSTMSLSLPFGGFGLALFLCAYERNKKVQQAKKQQKEIMKQINKELHKISQAQQTVIEALKKIEPLKWKLWNLQEKYHELKHMGFIIPIPVEKFALPNSILKEWARL